MSAFARLFDVGGTQVVYILGRNPDGRPSVTAHACAGGIFFDMATGWEDSPDGWQQAEDWLAGRTPADAIELYNDVADFVRGDK